MSVNVLSEIFEQHDVVLFMNGTPDAPFCAYGKQISSILEEGKVEYRCINLLEDDSYKNTITNYCGVNIFPQLFIHGEPYGGCEEVTVLYENDNLSSIFNEKHINNEF